MILRKLFSKFCSGDEIYHFYGANRLVNRVAPQGAAGWWHNLELYYCHEDGNYYAVCDKRFFGFKMENTVVRCKSEELGRKVLEVMDYNPNYVEFRNHPETQGCYLIENGHDHLIQFNFHGNDFDKTVNINTWHDLWLGDKTEPHCKCKKG